QQLPSSQQEHGIDINSKRYQRNMLSQRSQRKSSSNSMPIDSKGDTRCLTVSSESEISTILLSSSPMSFSTSTNSAVKKTRVYPPFLFRKESKLQEKGCFP
ncbi:hypothetical protein AABB24_018685, partial [Solanum stoloniferum]